MQPKEKFIYHNIPGKPGEVIRVDIFTLDNKNYLCIVDYHGKFPVMKKTEDFTADSLILACKIFFQNIVCQGKSQQAQAVTLFQIYICNSAKPEHRTSNIILDVRTKF